MVANIPQSLKRHIKSISADDVEMDFSLHKLTRLQKLGNGIADAEKLLVRLRPGNKNRPIGFCVHLSNERAPENRSAHTLWMQDRNAGIPNDPYCKGIPNRVSYQASRDLSRHLSRGFISLDNTYNSISTWLGGLGTRCVVCGARQGVHLKRPTTCNLPECKALFKEANYEIHVRDIWTNTASIDLLISAICAISEEPSNNQRLMQPRGRIRRGYGMPDVSVRSPEIGTKFLKVCPISEPTELRELLDRIPPMKQFSRHLNQTMTRKGSEFRFDEYMEQFLYRQSSRGFLLAKTLTWVCSSYEGFLTPVNDKYRIHGFGNCPQFLLANAPLKAEQRFAKHFHAAKGRSFVLFHGTKLSRLHSILRTGLQVCSGTSLETHGAGGGAGIYLSPEPEFSSMYAIQFPWGGSPAWKNSAFADHGALLACEVVASASEIPKKARSSSENPLLAPEIIIKDPARVIVRYVILVGGHYYGMQAPAHDVVPHFKKAFRKLRSAEW
ncbi:Poly [ADP-ribose] polymerase 6 [Lecanora helva]